MRGAARIDDARVVRVLILGGSGFFGRALAPVLSARGDAVLFVTRQPSSRRWLGVVPGAHMMEGDGTKPGAWQTNVGEVDAVVHLAAPSLYDHPWLEIEDTYAAAKLRAAQALARAVVDAPKPPRVVLFASSTAVYGDRADVVDERAPLLPGPHATLFEQAEAALAPAAERSRVVALRFGTVLGPGGALVRWQSLDDLPPPSSRGFPWIHVEDAVSATLLALDRAVRGPFNLAAPDLVDVAGLHAALAPRLNKPAGQGLVGKLFGGAKRAVAHDARPVLFTGQKARPSAALALGYSFRYPKLDVALRAVTVDMPRRR